MVRYASFHRTKPSVHKYAPVVAIKAPKSNTTVKAPIARIAAQAHQRKDRRVNTTTPIEAILTILRLVRPSAVPEEMHEIGRYHRHPNQAHNLSDSI
jgi:hypothetical protein